MNQFNSSMTRGDVFAWIRRAERDEWYRDQLPFLRSRLEFVSGHRQNHLSLFFGINKRLLNLPPEDLERYGKAIKLIDERRVIWIYFRHTGKAEPDWKYFYLDPPDPRPVRQKLCPLEFFDIFCLCASCGGSKWLPVKMNGKPYAMCYNCAPPDQWPAIGAEKLERNLIAEHVGIFTNPKRTTSYSSEGLQLRAFV